MDRLPTLRQVFNDYLVSRQNLKPSTILDYRKRLKCVEDWLDLPVSAITKDMVEEKHREISIKGKAQANVTFRVVRALLNYARSKYENEHEQPILKTNVVSRLTEVRAWNKVRGRRTIITAAQMPDWWRAVSCLRNRTVRDYLMLLMLTGLRRSEAASLQWKDVDLQAGFLRVLDPKNGEHHELPLSDFLWDMLRVRKAHARKENPHVFPASIAFSSVAVFVSNCMTCVGHS
jgi:integrase